MIADAVVRATHRGVDVVLGRPNVSPHVLGPKRMRAARLMDSLPAAPPARDWIAAAAAQCGGDFRMLLNDRLGDCTIADGPGHCAQIWTANNGAMVTPPDADILTGYEKVDGYVEGDPSTDQGGIETDVLAYWKAHGIAGSKLDDWIPVDPRNLDHIRKVVDRYGVAYIGVSLPLTAQDQPIWTLDISGGAKAEAGSWGGHCVSISAYDSASFDVITWGMRQKMSIDWFLAYCDEAYAPLCKALWCPKGTAPSGYTAADLDADLAAVA